MEIPKAWLALLAAGLVIALLVVAYLVGRESGRRATDATRVDPPAAAPMGDETAGLALGDEAPPAPVPPPVGSSEATHQIAFPPPVENPPDVMAPPPAASSQSTAVAAYFAELEGFERQAKYWSNPQELAMTLIGQGAQGDTSGFDKLLEAHRAAERQIESMTVPFPCQEHHRRTLGVLRQALELLQKLQGGVASGDLDGLLSLTGESRQLEAETREIDALAEQLKRRFGLAAS